MFEYICKDIERYRRGNLAGLGTRYLVWHTPELKALLVYRLGCWLRGMGGKPAWWLLFLLFSPLFWLLTVYYRLAYDIYLEQSAEIGPGLFIAHCGGVRVRNCRIGEHCSIHQEVCLEPGANDTLGPIIGNRVWIGGHVRIQGAVNVGDRATIGAGSLVTHDVPEGCLFMGNPARVVQREYDNSDFL
jgi:serine O-acetyltransferase